VPLLAAVDYPAVRAALDLTIDAATLPDAVIALPIFAGRAEQTILRLDPAAPTRSGEEAEHVRRAVIYLTAAYIAPHVPDLLGEQFGPQRYTRAPQDWRAHARYLQGLAELELAAVIGEDALGLGLRPRSFDLARGGRGR
jgi:hypothetical protein